MCECAQAADLLLVYQSSSLHPSFTPSCRLTVSPLLSAFIHLLSEPFLPAQFDSVTFTFLH